jgi:AraC-like DNA-binding protein
MVPLPGTRSAGGLLKSVAPMTAAAVPPFEFRWHVPAAPLSSFVEAIWAVRGSADYHRSVVLPNGALQLMLNFGEPHRVLEAGGRAVPRSYVRAWIAGLQDAPLTIESPLRSDLVAVRFRPGGAHAMLPGAMHALTNDVIEADDLLGGAVESLRDAVAGAPTRAAQFAWIERWLLARCAPREPQWRHVERALAALRAPDMERRSVRETCERLGLSGRHLTATFRSLVGLTPGKLARIERFHASLADLQRAGGDAAPRLAHIAALRGYADQAHFNHEFRRFAGVTPREFVGRAGEDGESIALRDG